MCIPTRILFNDYSKLQNYKNKKIEKHADLSVKLNYLLSQFSAIKSSSCEDFSKSSSSSSFTSPCKLVEVLKNIFYVSKKFSYEEKMPKSYA